MTDHNTPEYLDKIRQQVFDLLRDKEAAPGVQMHGEFPLFSSFRCEQRRREEERREESKLIM